MNHPVITSVSNQRAIVSMRQFLRRRADAVVAFFLLAVACLSPASSAAETEWLGTNGMRQALLGTIALDWSQRPLEDGLKSLAENQRIAIWLDRRIDPGQKMTLSTKSASVEAVIQEIARRVDAQVGYVGPVVYIGPPPTAAKLWTICEIQAEQMSRLPREVRTACLKPRAVRWDFLSTPRELLRAAANSVDCTVEGLDFIPHDLWRESQFPELTLVEELTILLAGFDLTFQVDGATRVIKLIRLPENPQIKRDHTIGRTAPFNTEAVSKSLPNAKIERSGTKLTVIGRAEDHDAIQRILRGEKRRPEVSGEAVTRYSLKITNIPLGEILKTLEVRAGLKMNFDAAITEELKTRVSVDVKEASLEQLLTAAFRDTNLRFTLSGTQLNVTAK